jgi:hypothetical protein
MIAAAVVPAVVAVLWSQPLVGIFLGIHVAIFLAVLNW